MISGSGGGVGCSFDMLVNGGGSVTLNFQRKPFQVKRTTVMVPWNRLVTMDAVVMVLEGGEEALEVACPDVHHDHYNMRPVVLSTWQHTQLGACPETSTVIPESQVSLTCVSLWLTCVECQVLPV